VSSFSRVASEILDLRNCTSFCESSEISVAVIFVCGRIRMAAQVSNSSRVYLGGGLIRDASSYWLHDISVLIPLVTLWLESQGGISESRPSKATHHLTTTGTRATTNPHLTLLHKG
jgi:hypothetical protein